MDKYGEDGLSDQIIAERLPALSGYKDIKDKLSFRCRSAIFQDEKMKQKAKRQQGERELKSPKTVQQPAKKSKGWLNLWTVS